MRLSKYRRPGNEKYNLSFRVDRRDSHSDFLQHIQQHAHRVQGGEHDHVVLRGDTDKDSAVIAHGSLLTRKEGAMTPEAFELRHVIAP